MLSRLSVMKTHTGNAFQHLRARGWISGRRARTCSRRILSRAWLRIVGSLSSFDRPFPSPRLALPPFLLRGYPMPSTRYEACLITRSVHGPIELPSCRRSPSPLSRSPLESVRPSSHPFPFAPPQASVLDPFQRSILSDEIAIDSAFVYRKRKCATSIA